MSLWDSEEPVLVKPMLAFPAEPFDSKEFLMEIKYDGTRCIAYVDSYSRKVMFLNRRFKLLQEHRSKEGDTGWRARNFR